MMGFMKKINQVLIEFSLAQAELIGKALVRPGHLMLSNGKFEGMSVADDNWRLLHQISTDSLICIWMKISGVLWGVYPSIPADSGHIQCHF